MLVEGCPGLTSRSVYTPWLLGIQLDRDFPRCTRSIGCTENKKKQNQNRVSKMNSESHGNNCNEGRRRLKKVEEG